MQSRYTDFSKLAIFGEPVSEDAMQSSLLFSESLATVSLLFSESSVFEFRYLFYFLVSLLAVDQICYLQPLLWK